MDEDEFLRSPLFDDVPSQRSIEADPLPIPKRLGEFDVIEKVGEGGMGVVFKTRQRSTGRFAAVKVVRQSLLADESVVARFHREIEFASKLNHPGIARVFCASPVPSQDGDPNTESSPWFAMEWIEGERLKSLIQSKSLSFQAKLSIFGQLAHAVAYAHEEGMVHRDLKPDNVLVEWNNDSQGLKPRVKLVDFGIAKLVSDSSDNSDATHDRTKTGLILGSPQYMSPERLFNGETADTPSVDVYSIGVIAYELFADVRPFELDRNHPSGWMERLYHEEPKRLALLEPKTKGDLEAVIYHAMNRSVSGRYPSAVELSNDLKRYGEGMPVSVRMPSRLERFATSVQNNRLAFAGIAAAFVATLLGLVGYAIQAEVARTEAETSMAQATVAVNTQSFMTNEFFPVLVEAVSNQPSTDEAIAYATQICEQRAAAQLNTQPAEQASILNELATVSFNSGQFDDAARRYELAQKNWERLYGRKHRETLKAIANLGLTQFRKGNNEVAKSLLKEAYQGRVRILGEENQATLRVMNNLSEVYRRTGELEQAVPLLELALEIETRVRGANTPDAFAYAGNLASVLTKLERYDQAILMQEDLYRRSDRQLGSEHYLTINASIRLAQTQRKAGLHNKSLETLRSSRVDHDALDTNAKQVWIAKGRFWAKIEAEHGDPGRAIERLKEIQDEISHDSRYASQRQKIERQLEDLFGLVKDPSRIAIQSDGNDRE